MSFLLSEGTWPIGVACDGCANPLATWVRTVPIAGMKFDYDKLPAGWSSVTNTRTNHRHHYCPLHSANALPGQVDDDDPKWEERKRWD